MSREVVYDPNKGKFYNVEKGESPSSGDKGFSSHADACYNGGNPSYPTDGVRELKVRYSDDA
jgi:hypothetical protein